MKAKTEQLIKSFEHNRWFHACGSYAGDEFHQVRSKSEAVKHLLSRKWDNFSVSIGNRFSRRILGPYGQNESINAVCDEIHWEAVKLITEPLEAAIADTLVGDEAKRIKAHQRIMLDLLDTLRECEFAETVPPLLYVPVLLPLYLRGNLPCGWTGAAPPYDWNGKILADLPPGRIRVY